MKQNKFKIVIPSYNNEKWIEPNLASVLNQTYTNYDVLYIDDASTDNTYKAVTDIVGGLPNWVVILNKENKGASYNYTEQFDKIDVQDDDIIIHLDGDDWLIDDSVLAQLNDFYNQKDCWMTYGGFVCWDGTEDIKMPYPQSTPYPKFVHDHKLYRQDMWRASHLRTFRYFLWNSINRQDLVSQIDDKLFWHASDLSWQYPCLEMCAEERIGVVDFYTCVYNQSKSNATRTQEREHQDNAKYESEIRNKKKYRVGIGQGTMPQVNVYGDYMERHTMPIDFTYCYNRIFGEYDAVLFQDDKIIEYLLDAIDVPGNIKVIARVAENKNFFNQQAVIDAILLQPARFDLILTWDESLLKLPQSRFCPLTDSSQFNVLPIEMPKDAFQVYPKSKTVSAISSTKAMVPGHTTRLQFIASIQNKVDLYGRGIREIASKLEGLADYRFSVAIENAMDTNYFTEKITDCFLTGTIPIYYGCPNIDKFFDINGIIAFTTQEELDQILNTLTPELYESKLHSVKANFKRAFSYPTDTNSMYKLYYKELI